MTVGRSFAILVLAAVAVSASAESTQDGLVHLRGQHLELVTDLPRSAAIERLTTLFDAAVPQWAARFNIDRERLRGFRVRGCLMADRRRFRAAGLLTEDVPDFRHGYAMENRLWLDEQSSDYYRRHLLLHEGTHAFQARFAPGECPPWLFEGLAELCGTHRLDERGTPELGWFPSDRDSVPDWGRIKLVHDSRAAENGLSLEALLALSPTAHQRDEPYGWCWALAVFLEKHPRFRERFAELIRGHSMRDASQQVLEWFDEHQGLARFEWQTFLDELQYGYDLERAMIEPQKDRGPLESSVEIAVAADRGWQLTGYQLEAGRSYRFQAEGRFVVARTDRDWPSQADGVTARYVRGEPLGILQATVWSEGISAPSRSVVANPAELDSQGEPPYERLTLGREGTIRPRRSGQLLLRVNDSPAERGENSGRLSVRLVPE